MTGVTGFAAGTPGASIRINGGRPMAALWPAVMTRVMIGRSSEAPEP